MPAAPELARLTDTPFQKGLTAQVYALNWNTVRRNVFLSGSWDDSIKLWDLQHPGSLATFTGHTYCVYAAVWCASPGHSVRAPPDARAASSRGISNGVLRATVLRSNGDKPITYAFPMTKGCKQSLSVLRGVCPAQEPRACGRLRQLQRRLQRQGVGCAAAGAHAQHCGAPL